MALWSISPQTWIQKNELRLLLEKRLMAERFPQFVFIVSVAGVYFEGSLKTYLGNVYLVRADYPEDYPENPEIRVYLLNRLRKPMCRIFFVTESSACIEMLGILPATGRRSRHTLRELQHGWLPMRSGSKQGNGQRACNKGVS